MIKHLTVTAAMAAAAVVGLTSPAHATPAADCPNGYVGLTYDDGPTPATLPGLLTALKAAGARATFFNQGNNAQARPDLVLAERRAGMWIGNHTFDHPHLTQIGEPAAFDEIQSTQQILRGILGGPPTLFRPPFGETDDQVRVDENQLGLLEVLWTVDSQDWNGASVDQIIAAADTLQNGGIILMHDWPPNTTQALPTIVSHLRARGLCPGKIVFTPRDIPFGGTVFHAVAVAP